MKARTLLLSLLVAVSFAGAADAPKAAKAAKTPARPSEHPWGPWVEPDFPFFSSVLDARREGLGSDNLTPRGLVLKLPNDCWACFDTDLLRVSAIWRGPGVTDKALAPGSYHDPSRKTPGGQFPAPQPDGKLWLGAALIPGWQTGAQVSLTDPRSPAPSPEEVGRGPLPEAQGRFRSVQLHGTEAVLEYTVADATVREWWTASLREDHAVVERHVTVSPAKQDLWLVIGNRMNGPAQEVEAGVAVTGGAQFASHDDLWLAKVPAHAAEIAFCVTLCDERTAPAVAPKPLPSGPSVRRWPQTVTAAVRPSAARAAYVVDHIDLPVPNPWKRAFRCGDIQFQPDGTAVVVTLDGDVWLGTGLGRDDTSVRWRRFASGFHEPMTCALRGGDIFVFDRNGVWRLRDTDGDGEADVHELFSNAFAQTADMREFPNTIRPAPDGSFVIAKGGQEATTLGKHNGTVLRLSPDGRTSTVLGYGFRQPNIAVDPRTGLVTASDQEGQYIPSTPLHIVKDGQFYGFLGDKRPREQYPAPIAEPLTWVPHAINASALSQVWLHDERAGPLAGNLVQICFNKPDLLRMVPNPRGARPQAAMVSVTTDFDFTPLNGSLNPTDGQLYLAGFQVIGWGNVIDTLSGLGRVRYTGAPSLTPRTLAVTSEGILLGFDVKLDPAKATDLANYSVATWHYKRRYTYGSAQYKADDKPGNDWLVPSSVALSADGRSVFLGIPGLKPVEQLRLGWSIASADGAEMRQNAFTTPYELTKFDPKQEGFGDLKVDLTPRAAAAARTETISAEEGRRLATTYGCVACHSVLDIDQPHVGPKWKGLYGSKRDYVTDQGKKGSCVADDAYLRESILEPNAKKAPAYAKGEYAMPSFAGVLSDAQVASLILYIRSLK